MKQQDLNVDIVEIMQCDNIAYKNKSELLLTVDYNFEYHL